MPTLPRLRRSAPGSDWRRRRNWRPWALVPPPPVGEQLAADPNVTAARGRAAMNTLARSKLATPEDLDFIASITDLDNVHALEEALTAETVDAIDFIEDTEGSDPEETP